MKRRLRSIQERYPSLGFWWPLLVIIFLLCLMIILKQPYIIECATVALVFVTSMYVIFTKRILDEMRRQRLNASQAVIWPVVWWREYYLEITLNNIGNAPVLKTEVFLQDKLIIHARSHIPQGDKVVFRCLEPGGGLVPRREPLTPVGIDGEKEFLKRIAALVGQYPLVVRWYDLLDQQFEATLLFSLHVSEGLMLLEILEEPKLRVVKG